MPCTSSPGRGLSKSELYGAHSSPIALLTAPGPTVLAEPPPPAYLENCPEPNERAPPFFVVVFSRPVAALNF